MLEKFEKFLEKFYFEDFSFLCFFFILGFKLSIVYILKGHLSVTSFLCLCAIMQDAGFIVC